MIISLPTVDMPTVKERIIAETSRIEEDATYSAKGHYNASAGWRKIHYWIGIPTVIAAALTAAAIFKEESTVALVLTGLVTVSTAVTTFLNPNEKADNHHSFGNSFNDLKDRARRFREIDIEQLNDAEAASRLSGFGAEKTKLNADAPPIPWWAFSRARRSIEQGEARYAVDEKVSRP